MEIEKLEQDAKEIREEILKIMHKSKSSHIGGAFSILDIINALYSNIMDINVGNPEDKNRDRFILSKGHCSIALYSILCKNGFFPKKRLENYCQEGKNLKGHIDIYSAPGIDSSAGSLGHGLSIGVGMALAGKYDKKNYRTFVVLGDGECQEGSIWEAAMSASRFELENLVAIVDVNQLQGYDRCEKILSPDKLKNLWKASGWSLKEIDAHDYRQILDVFSNIPFEKGKPNLVFANSIKGKGVSYMEGRLEWHYKSPNEDQLKQALEELS